VDERDAAGYDAVARRVLMAAFMQEGAGEAVACKI
jgi:hypothetical protein